MLSRIFMYYILACFIISANYSHLLLTDRSRKYLVFYLFNQVDEKVQLTLLKRGV